MTFPAGPRSSRMNDVNANRRLIAVEVLSATSAASFFEYGISFAETAGGMGSARVYSEFWSVDAASEAAMEDEA